MYTGVLVILVVPFLWSAAVAVLKRIPALRNGPQYLDDKTEKRHLALMLLPVFVGLAMAVAARFISFSLPVQALPITKIGEAVVAPIAPVAVTGVVKPHIDWMPWAVMAGLTLYGAGLALHAARLALGLVRLGRLASKSRPAADWGKGVRLTPVKTTPLAFGRATILMPESLIDCLSHAQVQMILRHEREHLKRGDARWFVTLAAIDAVFWFNPFVRRQTQTCRLAAELACDAAVVATAPEMRRTYAEALVRVLKHAAGDVRQYAPTAFSPEKSGDYRMRISEIMQPPGKTRKPRLLVAAVAAALVLPLGLAQFAWSQVQEPAAAPVAAPTASAAPAKPAPVVGKLTARPIDLPMTNAFGPRKDPFTGKPGYHNGVDFKAPVGTAVKAAGDGIVSAVYDHEHYGKVVEIDHGNTLMTRYAHLDTQTVKVGDTVVAGQPIATSGNTGTSTGPHLHVEVWKNHKPVNPATELAELAH
ncbi:M23/M56 family metallopeptidase [Asticcacaulis solisilvae]|uniref:M23/M56 family metallopeptidase n=1 Tax=Asticcacaulis solisilvae TaxID=1217274 RepID=UPI003FD84C0A